MERKKGFTLVELLVVIAILAILAAVSVVGYLSFTNKAKISVDESAVTEMNTVLKADEALNGKPKTGSDVKRILVENGYSGDLVTYYNKYSLGWLSDENVIVLIEETKIVYPDKYKNYSTQYLVYLNEVQVNNIEDFKAAVDELQNSTGFSSIKLESSLDFGSASIITVPDKCEFELDLNGNEIKSDVANLNAIEVHGNGSFEVKNGTITAEKSQSIIHFQNKANVKIDNVILKGYAYGIVTNGAQTIGSKTHIINSTITSSLPLTFNDKDGFLNIENSTFNGSSFIIGGNVKINGSIFKGTFDNHCDFKNTAIKLWTSKEVVKAYQTGVYYEGTNDKQTSSDGAWSFGDGLMIIVNRGKSEDSYIVRDVSITNSYFEGYIHNGDSVGYGLRIIDCQMKQNNVDASNVISLSNNKYFATNSYDSNCNFNFT